RPPASDRHWAKRQQGELLFIKEDLNSSNSEQLEDVLSASDHPDLLKELVEISRRTFGAYIGRSAQTIGHPWAAARLGRLAKGSRILSIGTGISPLPLYLAQDGMLVECIDESNVARTLPPADDWNEYGFFDYGVLHENLAAYNSSPETFRPWLRYDAV